MARRYYIHERSLEFEAVERWENEGGRLFQNQHYLLDSIGEDYRPHKGQVMPIVRLGSGDLSDNARSITGQTVRVDGIRFEI